MADSASSGHGDDRDSGEGYQPEQPWHYEGSCPNCGKAVANDGNATRCVGCGEGYDHDE